MAGPCAGLSVFDFSWGMPGAIATLVLSDFGAHVIKVEPPTGDPWRAHPGWLAWNRGKQGIVLDLKTGEGREQAVRLSAEADVLVESFRPGVTNRLGIDYDTISRTSPGLVYCSISGFGQKGPLSRLKGYEGIVAAKSGRMLGFAGQTQREGPVYTAVQTGSWATSQAAVRGILTALLVREHTGRGQWVQTSLLQGMIPYDFQGLINRQLARRDPSSFPPDMAASRRLPTLQYIPARCKDGRWLQMANLMDRLFHSFIHAIGLGHIYEDARFKNAPVLTPENREILREMILERMQEKTLDEWMDIFIKDGNVAAEPYLYTLDGMKHPQVVHNRHAVEIRDPRVGPMKVPGLLVDLGETPGELGGPAPDLGQHTADVLARVGEPADGPATMTATNDRDGLRSGPLHPLEGITVLDFATVIAGPYSAALLADLGARVIKVDATPERESRRTGTGGNLNYSPKLTAGKEDIQVDLKTDEGRAIVHKLIARADVLLHNFRPGVPERLAIDYETCKRINPRLVHVYIGAYGATGPHRRRPGAHPLPGALFGGALRQAGRAVPPPPDAPMTLEEIKEVSRWLMRANEGNPDPNSSMAVATGIMLGLWARERSGRGQPIQVTMICANAWANLDEAFDYAGRPPYAIPDAECHGLHALYRLYPAREGWVFLACPSDKEWETFCGTIGRPDLLSDPRFHDRHARETHDEALVQELCRVFQARTAAEWEELLPSADVACVQADGADMGEFFEEGPHVRENEFVVEAEHPLFGKYLRHGGVVHFSQLKGRYGPGVVAGQHTRAILREVGYSDAQIDDLHTQRVVNWEEIQPVAPQAATAR